MPFFISRDGVKSSESDLFVPAWAVEEVEDEPKKKAEQFRELTVHVATIPFESSWRLGLRGFPDEKVPVRVTSLRTTCSNASGLIPLKRGKVDFTAKKVPKALPAVKKPSVSSRVVAVPNTHKHLLS